MRTLIISSKTLRANSFIIQTFNSINKKLLKYLSLHNRFSLKIKQNAIVRKQKSQSPCHFRLLEKTFLLLPRTFLEKCILSQAKYKLRPYVSVQIAFYIETTSHTLH